MFPGCFRTIANEVNKEEPTGIAKHKWPIIITTVIASLIGYFWKGRLESKDLEALQERLDVRVVAPREIKDLRLDNNIRVKDFEALVHEFEESDESMTTEEVLAAVKASFLNTVKGFKDIKHKHDLERLLLWVARTSGDEDGRIPRRLALLCISILVCNKASERVPPIMQLYENSIPGHLTREEFVEFVDALMLTFQFPTEYLTVRVQKAWPEGLYEPAKHYEASAEQMTNLAFDTFAIVEKQAAEEGAAEEVIGAWLPGFISRRLDSWAAPRRAVPVEPDALDTEALSCERVTRLLFAKPLCLWNRCQDEDEGAEVLEPIPELERERDFMAAEAFDGSRKGYVFKMGGFGLGYYRDYVGDQLKEQNSSTT